MNSEEYKAMLVHRLNITQLALNGVPLKSRARQPNQSWERCSEQPTLDFAAYEYKEAVTLYMVFDDATARRGLFFGNKDAAEKRLAERKAAGVALETAVIREIDFDL